MMQFRRYKALLIALVYLMTMGAEAFASLCCPCVSHRHEVGCKEVCCHVQHDCSAEQSACEGIHFKGECCKNRHSNDAVLYTLSEDEGTRRLVPVELQLVAVSKSEDSSIDLCLGVRDLDRVSPPILSPREGVAAQHALRAPPVMA